MTPIRKTLIATIAGAALATGCATQDVNVGENTKKGAAIGAAVGALAGFFVGDGEADEILGTAAIGAGLGAGVGVYMDRQQKEIEEIPGAEVERVAEDTLQVHFDSDILFAVDSATLSPQSELALDEFAQVMNEYPKTAIVIHGHTDSTGSESYNQALSERRATSVYNHMAMEGVSPDRMVALGYGESQPVADNGTEFGRSQNRRVGILVKGKS